MSFLTEMGQGAAAFEAEVGEAFTYDGQSGFKGTFEELNPDVRMVMEGFDTVDEFRLDATVAQFTAKSVTPQANKRIVYKGKTYNVKEVHTILDDSVYRFALYRA